MHHVGSLKWHGLDISFLSLGISTPHLAVNRNSLRTISEEYYDCFILSEAEAMYSAINIADQEGGVKRLCVPPLPSPVPLQPPILTSLDSQAFILHNFRSPDHGKSWRLRWSGGRTRLIPCFLVWSDLKRKFPEWNFCAYENGGMGTPNFTFRQQKLPNSAPKFAFRDAITPPSSLSFLSHSIFLPAWLS